MSANMLKFIAIIAMFIDHTAVVMVESGSGAYILMRFIGRLTAPIMFYFVVVGLRHTKNVTRYTLRLALFATISYLPFIYANTGQLPNSETFLKLNVIYTILIGVFFLRARSEISNPFIKTVAMALLVILSTFGDWNFIALLMMLVFDYFYGDYKKQKFAYNVIVLTAGGVLALFLQPFSTYIQHGVWNFDIYQILFMQSGMFLPILLLGKYSGRLGRGGLLAKWSFYIFYPAHLLLLGIMAQ